MLLPPLCTGTFIIVGRHTHTQGIFLVLSASLEPRIRANHGGAPHGWVWTLSLGPLDTFRWSWGWPNRRKIHAESPTRALSRLWCYIKRKGSVADFTKATSSPSSKWGTCSYPKEMGIWFRAISLMWCGLLASIMYNWILRRKLIKEVWKSFGPTELPQDM